MDVRTKRFFILMFLLLTCSLASPGAYAHTLNVTLLDIDGNVVTGNRAYSPKRTCGTTGCHLDGLEAPLRYGITNNIYEDAVAYAVKDHGAGSPSYGDAYQVPYPRHGVSAGYHFQQGRNISWSDPQRNFYSLPGFTSSPGMFGKY